MRRNVPSRVNTVQISGHMQPTVCQACYSHTSVRVCVQAACLGFRHVHRQAGGFAGQRFQNGELRGNGGVHEKAGTLPPFACSCCALAHALPAGQQHRRRIPVQSQGQRLQCRSPPKQATSLHGRWPKLHERLSDWRHAMLVGTGFVSGLGHGQDAVGSNHRAKDCAGLDVSRKVLVAECLECR